ncbi:glycosyltransferase family 2 protein [Pontibacillus yanchengensis]|uniref:Glycosyl transferase family 2 n=1 Tax=Pontibacillus yanchengensis Y32 TaxID=1385514 RepID=A0A0A2TGB3_9BACI|nr:glycosyltransferase [Pontibacillus yanchengensis]KGP74604.1 glycosyl transferase family 2 [Pontibacillus yanchengensis Y32]
MLLTTLGIYLVFLLFRISYIFIPIFSVKNKKELLISSKEKSISVLVPAYNEEKIILNCLKGIQTLNYTNLEAIVINDGSKDETFNILNDNLNLKPINRLVRDEMLSKSVKGYYQSRHYPYIFVIDKVNGGKADALNAGIDIADKELIITLDADSVLEYNALQAMNLAFDNKQVIAAGGVVQIGQGFRGSYLKPKPIFISKGLIRFQIIQYFTDFYLHKLTQTKMNSITVISGAFGAFRNYALREVGGYRNTVGEDMDMTLRIQSLIKTKYKGFKMILVPEAICFTECPQTFNDLYNQRIRWQKAFIDCIWYYKFSFFRKLGFAPSLFLLVDSLLLGTLNAIMMVFLPLALLLSPQYYMISLGLFTITYILSCYQSIAAIMICKRFGVVYSKGDYSKILLFIPLEIISYRLLGILFVTVGTVLYLKNKEDWKVSRRVGVSYQTYD